MTVLHEPFYNLKKFGAINAGGRTFRSSASFLAWLRDETRGLSVFLKDTTDHRHDDVFADRRFLAEARHAFLIRRPEKIAASFYALARDMSVDSIRLEIMCELRDAVRSAGADPSVVVDSDDLAARPGATMAASAATAAPAAPVARTAAAHASSASAGPTVITTEHTTFGTVLVTGTGESLYTFTGDEFPFSPTGCS